MWRDEGCQIKQNIATTLLHLQNSSVDNRGATFLYTNAGHLLTSSAKLSGCLYFTKVVAQINNQFHFGENISMEYQLIRTPYNMWTQHWVTVFRIEACCDQFVA